MIGLSGVGKGRRRHRHLMETQHIIEFLDIDGPALLFLHCQMHCDAQIHFLGRFQGRMLSVPYGVSGEEQIQPGIGKKIVPALV